MSTNLAPIPDRHAITHQGIGTLGAGAPVLGAGAGPKTSPITRYLGALSRFKWLVILLAACGVGGGYFMSRLLQESYEVRGSFLVANNSEGSANPGQGNIVTTNEQWREFLMSYKLITPVVIGRQLFIIGPERLGGPPLSLGPSGENRGIFRGMSVNPDERSFRPGDYKISFAADGSTWELTDTKSGAKEQGRIGVDSIGRSVGFLWFPLVEPRWHGQSFSFRAITPREAADRIRKDLKIQTSPRSRYIYIELAGPDKDVITGTVNDLMQEAEIQALAQKQLTATRNRTSLDSMTRAAQDAMYRDLATLSDYQTRTATTDRKALLVAPGLAATTHQGVNEFNMKQSRHRELLRSIADLDTTTAMLQRGELTADRFASIPDVADKAQLMQRVRELTDLEAQYEQYLITYLPTYKDTVLSLPRIKERIEQLRLTHVPLAIAAVRSRLVERANQELGEINLARTQLETVPQVNITEQKLQNQAELTTRIYNQHAANLAAAQTTEMTAAADLAINDKAVAPLEPTKNRRKVIIALGALLGLAAGLGIAFLLDLFDSRVRYADQITAGLGLTILGVVPEVRRMKGDGSSVEEDAQVIEAFRTIRLNLAHAAPEGKLVLTISSPAPGEGKSFISSNLALSFADAGYRTLLIDGDTRRGELHRNFGVDRRPGLIDHLADNHPLEGLFRATTHPLCTLLPCGSRKRNAPELLGSARMREVIASQREHFDVIIVDSPPLGAGIDPFVLGTLTGNLALVVRAGSTQKDLAEAKLQVVDQLPIRLVGAILNDVHASTNLYRYYSYNSGYAAFDETANQGQLASAPGGNALERSGSETPR